MTSTNDVTTVRFYHRLAIDGTKLVLTNWLFGMPLYAFYIFQIEAFGPDDIQGVLMSIPFDVDGPYENFDQAKEALDITIKTLDDGYINP